MGQITRITYLLAVVCSLLFLPVLDGSRALAGSAQITCARGSCSMDCNGSDAGSYCRKEGLPRCFCGSLSKTKGGVASYTCDKTSCSQACAKGAPRGVCVDTAKGALARCFCG